MTSPRQKQLETIAELYVLVALGAGPLKPQELIRQMARDSSSWMQMRDNSVYRVLYRFESWAWAEQINGGWQLTARGRQMLKPWVGRGWELSHHARDRTHLA